MGKEISSVRGSLWNLDDGWFGAHCEVVLTFLSLFHSWLNRLLAHVCGALDPGARDAESLWAWRPSLIHVEFFPVLGMTRAFRSVLDMCMCGSESLDFISVCVLVLSGADAQVPAFVADPSLAGKVGGEGWLDPPPR